MSLRLRSLLVFLLAASITILVGRTRPSYGQGVLQARLSIDPQGDTSVCLWEEPHGAAPSPLQSESLLIRNPGLTVGSARVFSVSDAIASVQASADRNIMPCLTTSMTCGGRTHIIEWAPPSLGCVGEVACVLQACDGAVTVLGIESIDDAYSVARVADQLWSHLGDDVRNLLRDTKGGSCIMAVSLAHAQGIYAMSRSALSGNYVVCADKHSLGWSATRSLAALVVRPVARHICDDLDVRAISAEAVGILLANRIAERHWVHQRFVELQRRATRDRCRGNGPRDVRDRVERVHAVTVAERTCVVEGPVRLSLFEEVAKEARKVLNRAEGIESPTPKGKYTVVGDCGNTTTDGNEDDRVSEPIMVVAGNYFGFVEDCGCMGISRGGGVARLVDFVDQIAVPFVCLGNMVDTTGGQRQDALVDEAIVSHIGHRQQSVYVPGCTELEYVARKPNGVDVRLVVCNAHPRNWESSVRWSPFVDVEIDRVATRVIGVWDVNPLLCAPHMLDNILARYTIEDPSDAVLRIISETPDEMPIVVAGGWVPSADSLQGRKGRTYVIVDDRRVISLRLQGGSMADGLHCNAYHYGAHVVYEHGGENSWSSNKVMLNQDPTSAGAHDLLLMLSSGKSVEPGPQWRLDEDHVKKGLTFVGSEKCASCHQRQASAWASTGHGRAFATLQQRQKHRMGQCVGCHVTGYNYAGGFTDSGDLPGLQNVGCEVCHGTGSEHVATGGAMGMPRRHPSHDVCGSCHNPEHSRFMFGMQKPYMENVIGVCRGSR